MRSNACRAAMDDDSPYDISVSDDEDAEQPIDARRIERAVALTLREHQCPAATVSVALVSDACITELNERYLGHAGPTDVLSFDLSDERSDAPLDGQIVISWETAARQAAGRRHSPEAEMLLYAVHAALHLLGYDDMRGKDADAMHAEEDRILTRLGIGAVYRGAGT